MRPKAKFWPKAEIRPNAKSRPKRPFGIAVAPFTPSRNILQSSQKWKDISELMDATINWLERFGAARAPSDFDLTINWDLELSSTICVRDLFAVCASLNVGFHVGPTISSCRRPPLKWDGDPTWKSFVVCRFAFALIRCGFFWCTCLDPTINWKVNGILLLILSRRKVLNGLFETAFDFQSTDATTNWNMVVEE